MKPASYWNKRMEILEQSRYDGDVQSYHEIERIYRKQMAEMQKEINAWYGRFAKNNEISLADARKLLDAKELDELKWNVEDYIKYGEENALDQKWIKQLENASARYHISRLEALQLQIQQRAEAVMSGELDVIDARVREVYQENYYHTAFEFQRGVGIGWDLERLDDRRIDNVIKKPWAVDGKNFSERIWEQRDKLVNTLHQELTQSIIRGEDPERAVQALADRMHVSQSNARRLIMTESAAMASAAQKDCYNELDVEKYKIVATLDDLTCDVCAGLDGQVFKMSEYNVGTTAPPFHPNCRTVTVPYFADDTDSKRAARGADGKTYLVPADTKYTEWKAAFVDGEEKPFKVDPDWKPPEPEQPEPTQFINMNGIPIVFDKSMDQPNRLESKRIIEELCGEYDTRLTMIRVATSADAKDMNDAGGDVDFSGLMRLRSTKGATAIHEFAHSFTISDYAKKGLYDQKTEEFWKEMRKAFRDYKKDYRFDHKVSISFYSFDDVDEFMAEAFTVYKANQLGVNLPDEYHVNESSMKYVNRVGAIIDKYFKKPNSDAKRKIFFVEAKNISDAQEFAKNFAVNVDFKGISLKNANAINDQLTVLYNKYDIDRLQSIESTNKKGSMLSNFEKLEINGKKLGKVLDDEQLVFEKQLAEKRKSLEMYENRWRGKRIPPDIQKRIDELKFELKFTRYSVMDSYDEKVKVNVTHEFGHILADQWFGMTSDERANPNWRTNPELRKTTEQIEKVYLESLRNGDIHKISRYGRTNAKEFFAECFAAREMGEKLPPNIEKMMDSILSKGKLGSTSNNQEPIKPPKRKPVPEKASEVRQSLISAKVDALSYKEHEKPLTTDQIVDRIGGGDMTKGSCSSLAFAYAGNKAGFDVRDFRGGKSCDVFSQTGNIEKVAKFNGVKSYSEKDFNDYKAIRKLLQNVEEGKEYYLSTGKHAAIIRKIYDDSLNFHFEYLELQSRFAEENKFKRLNDTTLKKRFGCQKSYTTIGIKLEATSTLIDIESLGESAEFQALLEYINTNDKDQKKGDLGNVK